MKLFDEKEYLNDISLKERTNFRYALLNPQMEYIQELPFIQDDVINKKINTVSELTFTTPSLIHGKSVLEIIRPHYIIEAWSDCERHLFLVLNSDIKVDDKSDTVSFQVYEYPRQLAKDIIFEYEETSKTLPEVVKELLEESSWKLGYVDTIFEFMYRSFSFKQITLLEALQNIAQTYNALILWKSAEKTIEFINPSRIGMNKGLVLSEEKYLKGLDLQIDSEEIITRLYAYGHDNISIEEVTLAGSRYLEDYSWFMKPFKMTDDGEVLQSSYYMSDGLCKSLITYQNVLKENEGKFTEFLDEKKEIEKKSKEHWLVLTELKTEHKTITDKLDVLNSTSASSSEINKVIAQKTALEEKINEALEYDESLLQEILAVQTKITELHKKLKKDNYFTAEQLVELDNFTITKVFQDTAIEDVNDLFEDALYAFESLKKPKIKLNISLLNFLENYDYQFDWNKLELGDIITVELQAMDIEIYAQIMEIEYSNKDGDIQLVLANEKSNLQDLADDYLQLLYDSKGSSTVISMDKYKWDLAEDANDGISQILNNAWDSTKQQIQGGVSQSVTISERGLIIRSSEDPQKLLIAQNGVLGLSRDGGNTWKTAITPDGIFAERLVGRILMGNRLIIEDEDGIIKIEGSKQTVFDLEGNEKVILGNYKEGKYGLKINQGALEIVGGLTEENLSESLIDQLTDDSQLREDLRLESPLPNHLTLDSSGITAKAVSTTEDKYAKLDYRGLYVHGGALDIRTVGDSLNRGIVINGEGIKGYNKEGLNTFEFNSNGSVKINIVSDLKNTVHQMETDFTVELGKISSSVTDLRNYTNTEFQKTNSSIVQTSQEILSTVNKTIADTNTSNMNETKSLIKQSSDSIITSVDKQITDINGELASTNSKITQTASSLTSTINSNYRELDGRVSNNRSEIRQLDREISFKVSHSELSSEIRLEVGKMTFRANQINFDGAVFGHDATFRGTVRASDYLGADGSPHKIDFGSYGWLNGENNALRLARNSRTYIQIHDIGTINMFAGGSHVSTTSSNGLIVYGRVAADNISSSSDRKLKKNIEKFSGYALNKVLETDVYQYHFKNEADTMKLHLGLMYDEAPFEIIDDDSNTVDLYAMASMLWRAIQEQQIEINELKSKE